MADEPDPANDEVPAKKKRRRPRPTKSESNAKRLPWTFPKNTLEDAIRVPKAIEEKNAGNPMPARDLSVAVGFRQPQDWRYLDLLRSANQYGLVTGTGPTATIHLAKLGKTSLHRVHQASVLRPCSRHFEVLRILRPSRSSMEESGYPRTNSF